MNKPKRKATMLVCSFRRYCALAMKAISFTVLMVVQGAVCAEPSGLRAVWFKVLSKTAYRYTGASLTLLHPWEISAGGLPSLHRNGRAYERPTSSVGHASSRIRQLRTCRRPARTAFISTSGRRPKVPRTDCPSWSGSMAGVLLRVVCRQYPIAKQIQGFRVNSVPVSHDLMMHDYDYSAKEGHYIGKREFCHPSIHTGRA